jgi:TolB protein
MAAPRFWSKSAMLLCCSGLAACSSGSGAPTSGTLDGADTANLGADASATDAAPDSGPPSEAGPGAQDGAQDAADAEAGAQLDAGSVDAGIAAGPIPINLSGSMQNPCFSPDGAQLALTRFRSSYNSGVSDIVVTPPDGSLPVLVTTASSANVNLPGSCWNATLNLIVYSSDAVDRDEIWTIPPEGGSPVRVTNRSNALAWEPSFSPDGQWIVFESHDLSGNGPGAIWKVKNDGSGAVPITSGSDDRQPNWSPRGDRILFQSLRSGNWDIWTMGIDGGNLLQVTTAPGDDTDASFSPDGQRIVYSSDGGGSISNADLFVIPSSGGAPTELHAVPSTDYAGAPSWSPDGRWIAFETCTGSPDTSPGTHIAIVAAP